MCCPSQCPAGNIAVLTFIVLEIDFLVLVFSRFGDGLLSHVLRRSTIGATVLNFRVRDGVGCFTRAMITKPRKNQAALLRGFSSVWVSGRGFCLQNLPRTHSVEYRAALTHQFQVNGMYGF